MRQTRLSDILLFLFLTLGMGLGSRTALAENIDPDNDGSQYAWGGKVGWLNAEPTWGGVQVENTMLTGYIWAENIGWVSLNCANTSSCAVVNYGVANDGSGNLSGYGWSENAGWVSFSCTNTGSCAAVNYWVTINPVTGEFSGHAWGENIGWVSFSCKNTASCATLDWRVSTAWPNGPAGQQAESIPIMTGWGIIIFSLLMAVSALWFVRRKTN